jgi:hypothetical protein
MRRRRFISSSKFRTLTAAMISIPLLVLSMLAEATVLSRTCRPVGYGQLAGSIGSAGQVLVGRPAGTRSGCGRGCRGEPCSFLRTCGYVEQQRNRWPSKPRQHVVSWSRTRKRTRRASADRSDGWRSLPCTGPACIATVMPWWRVLQARVVQVRHGEGVGAAWRQPGRAPRQSPPAVTVMACCFSDGATLARPPDPPQPVQLRRQRPGAVLQVLQVAVAVERPAVDTAGPAAPVAGLRGARTGIVGLRPAGAFAALVEPRSGLDADLPGPAGLPAGHEVSPPLAWLPGSDQLAKQAGTAKPEPHGTRPPYSPAGGPAGALLHPR